MTPVILGTLVGFGLSCGATRLVASQVHGVSTRDSWSFGLPAVGFLLASALVCLWPAMKAARVDPVTVLRND